MWVLIFLLVVPAPSGLGQQTESAKELLRAGKAPEVIALLRPSLDDAKPNLEALGLLAEAYLGVGRADTAAMVAHRMIEAKEEDPRGYVMAARAALAQKRTTEALAVLRNALNVRKIATGPLWKEMAQILLAGDSIKAAIAAFVQAKEADSGDPAVYEGLGDAYARDGVTVMAIEQYERALNLDPLRAETAYKLARAYQKERRYNEAARLYMQTIQHDSTNTAALLELGRLYYAAKQYSKAAPYLAAYTDRMPDSIEVAMLAAEASFNARDYDRAAALARRVLKHTPTRPTALRIAANASVRLQRYQEAVSLFSRLEQVDTLQADDLKHLARAYSEIGEDSLAVEMYGRAILQASDDADLYGDLGALLMKIRKYAQAARAFEKRFTLEPSSVSAYINYGLSNMALGRWDTARAALRQAISLRPQYLQSHLFLARCLVQLDSLLQAKEEYQTVLHLADTTTGRNVVELAEAYGMIGFWHLLEKQYPQAIEMLTRSIHLKDDNPQTHLWRAQALALSKRREEAMKEYRNVLRLDPKNKDAKKGLEILGQK